MDNGEEMDKLLETYKFPRLSQEEILIENMNRPITSNETYIVFKKCRQTLHFTSCIVAIYFEITVEQVNNLKFKVIMQ